MGWKFERRSICKMLSIKEVKTFINRKRLINLEDEK